jgi:hypothetical protein
MPLSQGLIYSFLRSKRLLFPSLDLEPTDPWIYVGMRMRAPIARDQEKPRKSK